MPQKIVDVYKRQSEENPFFDEVLRGIARAEEELKDYGVRVLLKQMKGYDVARQAELITEMKDKVSALILNPINDFKIARLLSGMQESGTGIVAMNNDIENCERLCYVGSDYVRGGNAACGMMGLLTGGQAKVGVLLGSKKILGHNQRVEGFRAVMRERYPQMEIVDMAETNDDDVVAFEAARQMLCAHPQITALFVAAAGTYGVCRAVERCV